MYFLDLMRLQQPIGLRQVHLEQPQEQQQQPQEQQQQLQEQPQEHPQQQTDDSSVIFDIDEFNAAHFSQFRNSPGAIVFPRDFRVKSDLFAVKC